MHRRKIIAKSEKKRQTCIRYLLKGSLEQVLQCLGIMRFCHPTFLPSALVYQPIFAAVKGSSKRIKKAAGFFSTSRKNGSNEECKIVGPSFLCKFMYFVRDYSPSKGD